MNENSIEMTSETQKVDFFFLFWKEFHQPMAFASDNTSFIIRLRYQLVFCVQKIDFINSTFYKIGQKSDKKLFLNQHHTS